MIFLLCIQVCGRCHTAKYCSRQHQKLDWKSHKPTCKQIQWAKDPNLRLASLLDTAQVNLRGAKGDLKLSRQAAEQAVDLVSESSLHDKLRDPVRCKFLALRELLNHQVMEPNEAMQTCVRLRALPSQSGEAELIALSHALLALQYANTGRFTNARRELSQCDPSNVTHTDDRKVYYRARVFASISDVNERGKIAREIFDEVRSTAEYVKCLPTALFLCAHDALLAHKEQRVGQTASAMESANWLKSARNHAQAGIELLEKSDQHADRPLLKDLLLDLLQVLSILKDSEAHRKFQRKWEAIVDSVYVSDREVEVLKR